MAKRWNRIKMKITFTKYSANGNDFILIDEKDLLDFRGCLHELAKKICNRRFHVGADGLLVKYQSNDVDFSLEIYNSDGSIAEMCGNGSRCALLHHSHHNFGKIFKFRVWENEYSGKVNQNHVSIQFPRPELPKKCKIPNYGDTFLAYPNVRHLIVPVASIDEIDFESKARILRHHKIFGNEGTNVNFVEFKNGRIKARVFERGIEGETLCCTSGSVAIGVTVAEFFGWKSPITIEFPGGELEIKIKKDTISVSGLIQKIFQGEFDE